MSSETPNLAAAAAKLGTGSPQSASANHLMRPQETP